MAVLEILEFPDPRLRTRAEPVEAVDDGTRELITNMFETMYEAPGIGLAATQVNVHKRLLVMDVSEDKSEPLVFINPEYEVLDEALGEYDEGCLSVPGLSWEIVRPKTIHIVGRDLDGNEIEYEADELESRMFQHEMDHLDGTLLIERLDDDTRNAALKTLRELQIGRPEKPAAGGLTLP